MFYHQNGEPINLSSNTGELNKVKDEIKELFSVKAVMWRESEPTYFFH